MPKANSTPASRKSPSRAWSLWTASASTARFLRAHDGVARLPQEQGFTLLGYPNANQFTKYLKMLVQAGLLVLAQESVAHRRANTYALTPKARELFGLARANISPKTKLIRYSDQDVIKALEASP